MEPPEQRRREVLDGKRSWNKNENAGGDGDVFFTEYVRPIRELRDAGMFEDIREHHGNYRGASVIDRVDIIGAINLEA